MPSRVSGILWGVNNENVVSLGYPLGSVLPDREPRRGAEWVQGATGIEDAWLTGFDHVLSLEARFLPGVPNFDGAAAPNPLQSAIQGAANVQGFLDWARAKHSFAFVPDVTAPGFVMPGCYLADPVTGGRSISPRLDWSQTLKIRNPTLDLGLAVTRGLLFEYAPGADVGVLGLNGAFTSGVSSSGMINNQGLFQTAPAGPRDRHYPGGFLNGAPVQPRVTVLENTCTNLVTAPEDLTNGGWSKLGSTIPTTNNTSPRGDATACFVREDTSAGVHGVQWAFTLGAATDVAGFCLFLKAAGRSIARCRINNTGGTETTVTVNLANGTVTAGGANNSISAITPLAGGWFMVTGFGTPGGSSTSASIAVVMNNGVSESYTGDGASGMYVWGCLVTDGVEPGIYFGTGSATRPLESLNFPHVYAPMAMWVYYKFVELGTQLNGQSDGPRTFAVGSPVPQVWVESASGKYQINHHNGMIQVGPGSGALVATSYGQTVEHLAILNADGSCRLKQSINAGADQDSGVSAAAALATAWGAQKLYFNNQVSGFAGWIGFVVLRIGYSPAVTSIPLARAA
jgi:hypothetical protein